MKTIPILALLLLLALGASLASVVPFPSRDISELTVAELLCFTAEDGVTVTTEEGLTASGRSIADAIAMLEASAPGHLLLGTVDHVTFCGVRPDAETLLACGLRPAAKLFLAPRSLDPKAAAAFFRTHEGGVTIGALAEDASLPLPRLGTVDGRPYAEEAA